MDVNVVIAIGRAYENRNDDGIDHRYPLDLDDRDWQLFRDRILCGIENYDGVIHASIVGESVSGPWGTEDAAWFAGTVPADRLDAVREWLVGEATEFHQDAIALTVGTTELVYPMG